MVLFKSYLSFLDVRYIHMYNGWDGWSSTYAGGAKKNLPFFDNYHMDLEKRSILGFFCFCQHFKSTLTGDQLEEK